MFNYEHKAVGPKQTDTYLSPKSPFQLTPSNELTHTAASA